jgi:hypothetical protein
LLFIPLLHSCTTAQKLPAAIGVVALTNFVANENLPLPSEKNFFIFTDNKAFLNAFHMTKSASSAVRIPDFNGQSVVAIVTKPTTKVLSLAIDKAEITGTDLHVYYSITDTTAWSTYEQVNFAAATIPKSLAVKTIHFYLKDVKEKTLSIAY